MEIVMAIIKILSGTCGIILGALLITNFNTLVNNLEILCKFIKELKDKNGNN